MSLATSHDLSFLPVIAEQAHRIADALEAQNRLMERRIALIEQCERRLDEQAARDIERHEAIMAVATEPSEVAP